MLNVSPDSLPYAFASVWHPAYAGTLLIAALLLLMLQQARPPVPNLLRNSLIFLGLAGLLMTAAAITAWSGTAETAALLDSLAILVLGILVIRLAGLTLFRVLLPIMRLQPPRILEDILIVVAYLIWGLLRLRYAGLDLGSLVATSAVITAIIAFSMQDTLGNILGGIALQLDDSIHIGDWIKVDDVSGRVVEVHWRHTAVRTRNGEVVILPNSLLMKSKFTVVSSAETPQWRRWVYFSLSLEVPPQRVIGAVEKALGSAEIPLVSRNPAPNCVLMEFKEGIGSYAVRYWLTDALADDPTDSHVRVHLYAALQRQGWRLVPPAQDVRLNAESEERNSREREQELAVRRKNLSRVKLLAHLSEEEINHIAQSLTYAQFVKGDAMTRQGAVAHWLYVLIEGEADVWLETEGQPRRHMTTLTAGAIFGERGMLTGEPRRATVTARTDAECYRIDKKNFEKIMEARPEMAEAFARIMTEQDREREAMQKEWQALDHDQHRARLLQSIRRFFRLDPAA